MSENKNQFKDRCQRDFARLLFSKITSGAEQTRTMPLTEFRRRAGHRCGLRRGESDALLRESIKRKWAQVSQGRIQLNFPEEKDANRGESIV